jgi:hypothetical protein
MNDDVIEQIASSKILLDILMAFEDFLDTNDLYVYENWFKGEIVQGPEISRYWVKVTLKYPYRDMPDPAGAERLVKNGLKVKYTKSQEEFFFKDMQMTDRSNLSGLGFSTQADLDQTEQPELKPVWLVEITLPRRFIEDKLEQDLTDLENEINPEDVVDARSNNIDNETSSKADATADEETPDEGGDEGEEEELTI